MNNAEYINLNLLTEKQNQLIFEKKQTYNTILSRIHRKIITISRQRNSDQYLMYQIPSLFMGNNNYKLTECLEYVTTKLTENGFIVNYIDNGYIIIIWSHINKLKSQHIESNDRLLFQSDGTPSNATTSTGASNVIFKNIKSGTGNYIPTNSVFYNNA
jgi:hypothetical protein